MLRNWKLVRASWMVLLRSRMLLTYPVLSTAAVSIVAGYLPLALVRARLAGEEAAFAPTPQGILGVLILYVVTCTTVQTFNTMLVADAVARFDGTSRGRLRGWRVVGSRFPSVVAFAVLSSTAVSLAILVACRVARLLGVRSLPEPGAWALATFLGTPVIAVEGLPVRPALGRSEALLRATWGDRFVGGTGVLMVRIGVVIVAFAGGLGLLLAVALLDVDALTLATAMLWLATFIFLLVTGSSVSVIHATATYRHCIGRPVAGFEALHDLPGATPPSREPEEAMQPGTVAP